jgi:hypothetical protein
MLADGLPVPHNAYELIFDLAAMGLIGFVAWLWMRN